MKLKRLSAPIGIKINRSVPEAVKEKVVVVNQDPILSKDLELYNSLCDKNPSLDRLRVKLMLDIS